MADSSARRRIPVEFRDPLWSDEVGHLRSRSHARAQAERARRQIESGRARLHWKQCATAGSRRTRLPRCWKLYIPLDQVGASAAPYAFVFRLIEEGSGPVLVFIAFGERHPTNPETRSVYERAHRRLHGRYP